MARPIYQAMRGILPLRPEPCRRVFWLEGSVGAALAANQALVEGKPEKPRKTQITRRLVFIGKNIIALFAFFAAKLILIVSGVIRG
jgi:hypothetical protein